MVHSRAGGSAAESRFAGVGAGAGGLVTLGVVEHAMHSIVTAAPTRAIGRDMRLQVEPQADSHRTQKNAASRADEDHERLRRARPACKPGSVGRCRPDGHSSRIVIAHDLEQPTRGVSDETGRLSPPIRPCSDRGLPCRTCCQMRGGLLPRRFTLTGNAPPAVCSLWHFPSLQRSAQPLAGGPPYGARTFLGELAPHATVRPASL